MAVEVGEGGSLSRANSAVYLMVRNPGSGPDRLLGGETPVAAAVEVHESFLEGDVMRMREVATVEIPPGGEMEFKAGGLHIMLLDLRQALNVGDTISLTLNFQESGPILLRVPVRTMGGM
jgi:copper(I)-binding protein